MRITFDTRIRIRLIAKYLLIAGFLGYSASFLLPAKTNAGMQLSNCGGMLFFYLFSLMLSLFGLIGDTIGNPNTYTLEFGALLYSALLWLANLPVWMIAIQWFDKRELYKPTHVSLLLLAAICAANVIVIPSIAEVALGPAFFAWLGSMVIICCSAMLTEFDGFEESRPTWPPVCSRCGYDLRGQVQTRCPECGTGFDMTPITSNL